MGNRLTLPWQRRTSDAPVRGALRFVGGNLPLLGACRPPDCWIGAPRALTKRLNWSGLLKPSDVVSRTGSLAIPCLTAVQVVGSKTDP